MTVYSGSASDVLPLLAPVPREPDVGVRAPGADQLRLVDAELADVYEGARAGDRLVAFWAAAIPADVASQSSGG